MSRTLRTFLVLVALAALALASIAWLRRNGDADGPGYRTATVERGDLEATISATGVLQPEEVIDVGAQVAGQIIAFGEDEQGRTIDYGSQVDAGTVLARIDDSLYAADVAQATAQVEQARSGVHRARADIQQLQARLDEADAQWKRAQRLQASNSLAEMEYITYKSAYDVARANVAVGQAAAVQAEKAVAQAEATLQRARRNLGYCIIRSPVKGVIIDRRVNTGQTVVASLNAPSLFLLAKDLTRMEVWVAVNEADIGTIRAGQPVRFTVDAFPNRTFHGTVSKVRLNATMTQNVVTYTVEVTTDNSDNTLLPYLTANVQFLVETRKDVLLVPSAALRFTPPGRQAPPPPRSPATEPTGTLWILENGTLRAIQVAAGLTDGATTEVTGSSLKEGLPVVTGEQVSQSADSSTGGNPFTPQFRRGNRQQGRGSH